MLLPVVLAVLAAAPASPLPRAGHFGAGFNVEPLALGSVQAHSAGGTAVGVSLQTALQFDLGPRWALRLPLDLGVGGSRPANFAELGISPGLLYRWRDDADQRWVPYLGAGLRLGAVGAGRRLLGQPLVMTQQLRSMDWDSDGDGADDPNFESMARASPELWAGVEWRPSRWFALTVSGAYLYTRLMGTGVHVLHERVGLRLSL